MCFSGEHSNLPKTKYFFKKCFDSNQPSVFHFFCKSCSLYIGNYDELKLRQGDERCVKCSVCASENSLEKLNNGNFFIQLPIRHQLVKKIAEHNILNYDTYSHSNEITDVFDGELYKSLRRKLGNIPLITLTLNTDGVRVYKSKTKASLWPIQMFINEVTPAKRFKTDNIILSGIWFGKDPVFEVYLRQLIEEMNDLEDKKIEIFHNNVVDTVTVRVLLIYTDLPAKSKWIKMKQFNGEFGCTYCHHPGFMVGASTTSKYTVSSEEYRLRTHESTVALMKLHLTTGKESCGVTGVSPLIAFRDYDLIAGTVIDYLHCVLEGMLKTSSLRVKKMRIGGILLFFFHLKLGVTGLVTDLWFDSKNHRQSYYVTPRSQELVEKNISKITPITTFSNKPRPVADKNWWKAHEYKNWLLYYAVPCLKGIMKQTYLDHFTLFSEAIFIFLKARIGPLHFKIATKKLMKFHDDFEKLYGEEYMMHNVHLLRHIPKCVKDCGPLWAYSNFNFESNNGSLVKQVKGTTDVELQVSTKYAFNNVLTNLRNLSPTTTEFIDRCRSMKVKKSKKLGQITLFGSPHKHTLNANHRNVLLQDSDYVMCYYKFFFKNNIYFSSTYLRAKQTNDTVVMLNDKRVGTISLIFECGGKVSLLIKILHVEQVQNFPTHIRKIRPDATDHVVKVSAEEISQKLLLITTAKEQYISELPNQYEGD